MHWHSLREGFVTHMFNGNYNFPPFLTGNLALHIITAQGTYELRVDLAARSGDQAFAKYKIFNIADSTKNYQLIVEGFSGDASRSLSRSVDTSQNGLQEM